jgi:isoleucyl-tRNA synthetase
MSKSIGNVVDPFLMADKYGVDILRMWMYSVNQPGDSKNFDEKTVDEMSKKILNLLENVVKFYEMYSVRSPKSEVSRLISTHLISGLYEG